MTWVEQHVVFRVCDCKERSTRGTRRPEIEDKVDPCYQPQVFEPTVLPRENYRFTIRVTPSKVRELQNVITSMIEERTEGLSIKNMAGDVAWPRPGCDTSPTQKACCRLLGNWRQASNFTVGQKGLAEQVEVLNEYWRYTVSLCKREAGEQARAAVVVTSTSEHVF